MSEHHYTLAQARSACRANGIKLPDLAARYAAATGRSLYMDDPATKIDRDVLINAIKAWRIERQPQMTPFDIAQLVAAAYAIHAVLHGIDESKAYDFASTVGIVGPDPEPDHVIADRLLTHVTQADR